MNEKNELIEMEKSFKIAQYFAQSRLIPVALQKKPSDIFVIFQMAKELDIPPMQALTGIDVIQSKPTISPQLMLALIYSRMKNPYIEICQYDDKKNSVTVKMKRDASNKDEPIKEKTFTLENAKKLNLLNKDNWKKQPENMCKWRAVSACAREAFPDVIKGLYMPDELDDSGNIAYDDQGNVDPIKVENLNEKKPKNKNNQLIEYTKSLTNDKAKAREAWQVLGIKQNEIYTNEQIEKLKINLKNYLKEEEENKIDDNELDVAIDEFSKDMPNE